MGDKRKNFQSTFENMKSCLLELGFSGVDEIIEEDSGKLITGIQDHVFDMFIEITCKADIVNLRLSPTLTFELPDMLAFNELINTLNRTLMDIGHFSINEAEKEVLLQTSIHCIEQVFDREQMLYTIKRVVQQGLEGFKLLKEMLSGDECPYQMLGSYIADKIENQQNDEKTIH